MLRNPVYMGKIYVPEMENEQARLVNGVHEAIVPKDFFLKLQKILNKRIETNTRHCAKANFETHSLWEDIWNTSNAGRIGVGSLSSKNKRGL